MNNKWIQIRFDLFINYTEWIKLIELIISLIKESNMNQQNFNPIYLKFYLSSMHLFILTPPVPNIQQTEPNTLNKFDECKKNNNAKLIRRNRRDALLRESSDS